MGAVLRGALIVVAACTTGCASSAHSDTPSDNTETESSMASIWASSSDSTKQRLCDGFSSAPDDLRNNTIDDPDFTFEDWVVLKEILEREC